MSNITTPEASDLHRALHITNCTLRRRGHIVEELRDDMWSKVDIGRPPKEGLGVNLAKKYIRQSGRKSYNV